ncbi:MAG: fumarate hydratase [Lachnospiraceae bacterium]|nr:fumarate hydratase [Lachnospiraceae bacterium]
MRFDQDVVEKVCDAVIRASTVFPHDKKNAYKRAIERESNAQARWVLETLLENAEAAQRNHSPMCDDTGIPHILVEAGPNAVVTGTVLESIKEGVCQGLRKLPGRPMAARGDDAQRIAQSEGMYEDPGMLDAAPVLIRSTEEEVLRIYVLMFGGGPAIRAHTSRVFHKHQVETVLDQIVEWGRESVAQLGCSPCTLGVGVGRSHYEAAALMLQALVDGAYDRQSEMEQEITRRVNESHVGALGLGGDTTVLATFMKVGPQRASGVRIVCMRPCCCFEPRIASVELQKGKKPGKSEK